MSVATLKRRVEQLEQRGGASSADNFERLIAGKMRQVESGKITVRTTLEEYQDQLETETSLLGRTILTRTILVMEAEAA
jgi:hypothetical protein